MADSAQSAEVERKTNVLMKSQWRDIALFTSYGFLNNGLICVVYGAAKDITKTFGYPDSAPSVTFWSTVSCIMGPLLLLSWPLRSAGYRTRALVSCSLGLIGLLMLSFSTLYMSGNGPDGLSPEKAPFGFVVALAAVVLVALQQSIGENCACMRFRRFSKTALSCWGAGTGIAGIFPPLLYDAIAQWPLYSRFLVVIPILAVYLCICMAVYALGRQDGINRALVDGQHQEDAEDAEAPRDLHLNTPDGERSSNLYASYIIAVFGAVYGLEYFVFPTLVDRSTVCPATAPLGDQAYNNSWIAYNIGVTLSRASVAFFQFPCLWLVVLLQAMNVVGWVIEVNLYFLQDMGNGGYVLQYLWMVFVGLMGGTAYANCIRTFHCSPRIKPESRDRLINYAFAVSMVAILASTALGEILSNTILTTDALKHHCA